MEEEKKGYWNELNDKEKRAVKHFKEMLERGDDPGPVLVGLIEEVHVIHKVGYYAE